MRRSRVLGAAGAGMALTALGIGTPAAATGATFADAVPTVISATTVTGLPSAQKPKHVHKAHKPHKAKHGAGQSSARRPTKQAPRKQAPRKQSMKHTVLPATAASTSASRARTPHHSTPATAPRSPVSPPLVPNPISDVLQQVTGVAQAVFSIFGWNLLALIPMAGIALAISRQMRSGRRSASGWHSSV